MKKIKRFAYFIISIPKTTYFNFKYLRFKDAINIILNRVFLEKMKGNIIVEFLIKTGMIKIGLGETRLFDYDRDRSIWINEGTIIFVKTLCSNFNMCSKITSTTD